MQRVEVNVMYRVQDSRYRLHAQSTSSYGMWIVYFQANYILLRRIQ